MRQHYIYIFSLICGLALVSCEPEIDDLPNPTAGEADFSTYVALGNSLTAGYADNALYRESQENSYPALLAGQLAEVGGGAFNQPLVPAGNGANGSGTGRLVLTLSGGSPAPVPTPAGNGVFDPVSGSFNNFGVPGAKAGDLTTPGYGSEQGNPFFGRFATSPATTVVADAAARNPSFFTLWIGNNDVLGYATSGGEEEEITEQGEFNAAIDNIIGGLKGSNQNIEGAIANIPDITKIPNFTTVPYDGLVLDADQAALANATYEAMINPGLDTAVTSGVVLNVVTETAVSTEIIPGVAREVVKQQIVAGPACNTSADPESCAESIIQSGAADEDIENLVGALLTNYFLSPEDRDPAYNDIYAAIDAEVENNQGPINEAYESTLYAYYEELLPEEDLQALNEAIDSVFDVQVSQLKAAGFYPTFVAGPNAFVIVDEDQPEENPLGIRQMQEGELVLLSALAAGLLSSETAAQPKPDAYILDEGELAAIEDARTAFNNKLSTVARNEGFAFVDVAAFLNDAHASPLLIDGISYSTEFITGNIFSLDGVHLTQAGAAIVANEFIRSINSHYNASIPEVSNISSYERVALP